MTKDVTGFEGLYWANEMGDVYTYPKTWISGRCTKRTITERKLKTKKSRDGYIMINLLKEGNQKLYSVHRLIANTFIPNPENKPEVNHKNAIKSDNRVINLEWVTRKENVAHAKINGLMKKKVFSVK